MKFTTTKTLVIELSRDEVQQLWSVLNIPGMDLPGDMPEFKNWLKNFLDQN